MVRMMVSAVPEDSSIPRLPKSAITPNTMARAKYGHRRSKLFLMRSPCMRVMSTKRTGRVTIETFDSSPSANVEKHSTAKRRSCVSSRRKNAQNDTRPNVAANTSLRAAAHSTVSVLRGCTANTTAKKRDLPLLPVRRSAMRNTIDEEIMWRARFPRWNAHGCNPNTACVSCRLSMVSGTYSSGSYDVKKYQTAESVNLCTAAFLVINTLSSNVTKSFTSAGYAYSTNAAPPAIAASNTTEKRERNRSTRTPYTVIRDG